MSHSALENLQSLYDRNRFLEAYRQTAEFWSGPPSLERFSVDELILGARLANGSEDRGSRDGCPSR